MRVVLLCLAAVFAVTAWLIPPVDPADVRGWCCTRHDTLSFAGIPTLTWDRCAQWTRRVER